VSAGESIRVRFTVRNTGRADGAAFSCQVNLVAAEPGARPVIIEGIQHVEGVPAGGRSPQIERLVSVHSAVAPGNYEIVIVVDARIAHQVVESNEADNTIRRAVTIREPLAGQVQAPPRPTQPPPSSAPPPQGVVVAPPREIPKVDLVVDSVAVRATHSPIGTGSTVFVDFSIANRGQAAAASSTCFINLRYTKTDGRPGLQALASVAVPRLSPGDELTRSTSTFLPPDLRPGTAEMEVVLDPEYRFAESDESNNSKRATFTVAGPDLQVGSGQVQPGSASPGGSLSVQFTIFNGGARTASVAAFNIVMSRTRTMDSPVLVGQGDTGADRPPSTGTTIIKEVRIPESWGRGGANYLQVILDPENRIREENERNNTSDPILVMITP
jgi:subtilase family serine protease